MQALVDKNLVLHNVKMFIVKKLKIYIPDGM